MIFTHIEGRFPQKKRFEEYMEYLETYLFDREYKKNVYIFVKMSHNLIHEGRSWKYQDAGYCEVYEDSEPDELIISIELARNYINEEHIVIPYSLYEIAQSLAHEMVHAKQYTSGEFRPYNCSIVYGYPEYWWSENFRHNELPWERDALALESVLCDLW